MFPNLGAAPTPILIYARDISGNYERIFTQFSQICLLTRLKSITWKVLNYVTPFWGNSTPILKRLISLANRDTERAKDENRNHL